ncbi:MAG TPA: isochorismatase family protein [Chloroflexia bacterium]|nr:isochorismatase family protein [Chloroflexia bacterium]
MVSITPETTQHPVLGTQPSPEQAFLAWLDDWVANLPVLDLQAFMQENDISPENVGVISADLVVGFCYEGALASPRIAGVVPNAAEVMQRAYDLGVRQFALLQEYHTHDALEFEQFGPHCIRGTHEAETVEALASLPFADLFSIIHKNTLHPALNTDMDRWLAERSNLDTFVAVGDCTDLCIYQLAMYLKLKANADNKRVNVIVPADCVQTYDLPVELAQAIGAMPHDGDLLHAIFLYHMELNGARVVKEII